MSRLRAPAISALLALLGLALPAEAAPAPIVFDFEDGLQGWELHGSAQRVQTQVLGGEWAIFGDGQVESGASISIEMDLTDIAAISVEQFFIDGSEDGLLFFTTIHLIENIVLTAVERLDIVQPGNPSLRAADVTFRGLFGVTEVGFFWGFEGFESPPGKLLPPVVAFIDNITFHPVPEPGTLALLAVSLGTLAMYRRRIV